MNLTLRPHDARRDGETAAILAHGLFEPDDAKLSALLVRYAGGGADMLCDCLLGDALMGCVGVRRVGTREAEITHIAVAPDARGSGVGRFLLAEAARLTDAAALTAETDDDAVGFYRRCGFVCTLLPERWPGVHRYQCVWLP